MSSFINNPLLQINVVEMEDIKFFEVYPLSDHMYFTKYQTTSLNDLLEFLDMQCSEVI